MEAKNGQLRKNLATPDWRLCRTVIFKIIIEAGLNTQKEFAHNVLRGLTEEETRLCIRVFDKICNNAEEQLKNDKENES